MIYFRSDYSQGAHPRVLEALESTNFEHTDGYGLDPHCEGAARLVRELIGVESCAVHMMIGGTACNLAVIAASLKPYESVIAARTAHAYVHETGGVEATGHRVVIAPDEDGKLTVDAIARAYAQGEDEHTPLPRMVYLSQPTELGTIYTASELEAIFCFCKAHGLYLYVDGARLASALTCKSNDLSIRALARLCDAFYLGGTKNGALFGEALVILNDRINDHFRWIVKRGGALLAKGRLVGVQFEALLKGGENGLWFEIGRHENALAQSLRAGLIARKIPLYVDSPTNQVFPVLPAATVRRLEKDFFFYEWAKEENGRIPLRLVVGWGTGQEEIDKFLHALDETL